MVEVNYVDYYPGQFPDEATTLWMRYIDSYGYWNIFIHQDIDIRTCAMKYNGTVHHRFRIYNMVKK